MKIFKLAPHLVIKTFLLLLSILITNGCAVFGAAMGVTTFIGLTPGHQFEEVYYLGVFDPQEQVPPTVYRIIVQGKASSFSKMKFGSGWVPAQLVDSLNTNLSFGNASKSNLMEFEKGMEEEMTAPKTGRRLVMFGPEGFREAPPADHRLVIVMGASPEEYFQAMDSVLGEISQIKHELIESEVKYIIIRTFLDIKTEQEQLKDIKFASELENAQQQLRVVEQNKEN
jgi:hypothetical protein